MCSGPALRAGCAGGPDEGALQSSRGVEVITGPDHAGSGRAGQAVLAAQVVTDRFDQSTVAQLVAGERLGYLTPTDEAGREAVLPVDHALGAREQLKPSASPVTANRIVSLPQIKHRVGRQAQAGRAGQQTGDLC